MSNVAMKEDDKDEITPPPIPKEALLQSNQKKSSKEFEKTILEEGHPLRELGFSSWDPPSSSKESNFYSFYIILKETKKMVAHGCIKRNFQNFDKMYPDSEYIKIELLNNEIISDVSDKLKKQYKKLLDRLNEESINKAENWSDISNMCYELYAKHPFYKENNTKK